MRISNLYGSAYELESRQNWYKTSANQDEHTKTIEIRNYTLKSDKLTLLKMTK